MNHSALSYIDAQPYRFTFDPERTALMVIDMQRDFLEPGGFGASLGNDVSRLQRVVPAVRAALDAARSRGMLVVHTREGHDPALSDCPPSKQRRGAPPVRIGQLGPMGRLLVRGEPGHELIPALAPLEGEWVIDKPGKGAFYGTALETSLARRGIDALLVTGVTTEVCVQTTMREANDRGLECLLIEDATASYFEEFESATLAMIRAQGAIVGWTAPLEAVLRGLGAARG